MPACAVSTASRPLVSTPFGDTVIESSAGCNVIHDLEFRRSTETNLLIVGDETISRSIRTDLVDLRLGPGH
jgi:hypothetical protein